MPDQHTPDPTREWLAKQQSVHGRHAAALLRIADAARPGDSADPDELTARLKQIAALAADCLTGLLAEIRHEYMVSWHTSDDVVCISISSLTSLAQALNLGPGRVGTGGISYFTVDYRVIVAFSDRSIWISDWEPVDYRGTLRSCPDCAGVVFRGSTSDNGFLLDADPDPHGELVLIPNVVHGGDPGAIYGEQHRPGVRRYRRHPDNCDGTADV